MFSSHSEPIPLNPSSLIDRPNIGTKKAQNNGWEWQFSWSSHNKCSMCMCIMGTACVTYKFYVEGCHLNLKKCNHGVTSSMDTTFGRIRKFTPW